MNTKSIITALAIVILAGSLVYTFYRSPAEEVSETGKGTVTAPDGSLFREPESGPPTTPPSQTEQSKQISPSPPQEATPPVEKPEQTPQPLPAPESQPQIVTIVYTNSYTPSVITIRSGDTVTFLNQSSVNMWPTSGPHPTHTNYPEFDPRRGIPPGESYSFTFTKTGTWGFHDHLNPATRGTISVE